MSQSVDSSRHAEGRQVRVLMVTGAYPTASRPHWGTFIKDQVDSLIEAGVEIEVIHPRQGFAPLRYLSACAAVFLKTLSGRFDVVHGHYGLWCLVARMQWRAPVVASFLGSDLLSAASNPGTTTRKHLLVAEMSQWIARHVDAVIVKSEQMRKLTHTAAAFVIPNGVDFARFRELPRAEARAKLGWASDGYYVLFGNNPKLPVKDFALAEAAVERVRAQGTPVELMVANGFPHDMMPLYMNASNALILSSVFEGSPNVVKEAMACGVPVVATDVGDVAQVVGHTEGCFVCPRDPDALAQALQQAMRQGVPTTGRADIAHLDRARVARQVIEVYRYATCHSKGGGKSIMATTASE